MSFRRMPRLKRGPAKGGGRNLKVFKLNKDSQWPINPMLRGGRRSPFLFVLISNTDRFGLMRVVMNKNQNWWKGLSPQTKKHLKSQPLWHGRDLFIVSVIGLVIGYLLRWAQSI